MFYAIRAEFCFSVMTEMSCWTVRQLDCFSLGKYFKWYGVRRRLLLQLEWRGAVQKRSRCLKHNSCSCRSAQHLESRLPQCKQVNASSPRSGAPCSNLHSRTQSSTISHSLQWNRQLRILPRSQRAERCFLAIAGLFPAPALITRYYYSREDSSECPLCFTWDWLPSNTCCIIDIPIEHNWNGTLLVSAFSLQICKRRFILG